MRKLFLFCLFGILVVSCKFDNYADIESPVNSELYSIMNVTSVDDFQPNIPVDSVGYYHNEYLRKAINISLSKNSLNYDSILNSLEYGLEEEVKNQLNIELSTSNELDQLSYLQSQITPQAYELLIGLEELVKSNADDYVSLSNELDNILEASDFEEFNSFETYLIKGYAETLRSSSYFWFPISQGGSGEGDAFIQFALENNTEGNSHKKKLPGWARADGRGFGWGLVWGTITTANPVSGVVAGIGGAVGSSLMHGAGNR